MGPGLLYYLSATRERRKIVAPHESGRLLNFGAVVFNVRWKGAKTRH
jgi:hypothetical protein